MVIGIGGVSMAGKSTLAGLIKSAYPGKKVCILCQDDYVLPQKQIHLVNGKTDWENPASIDFDEYIASVVARDIENQIVIAEGLFAYYDSTLNDLYDKKLFIEISKETFFNRKRLDARWDIEPEWYIHHIWNSYLKFGKLPDKQRFVMKINGVVSVDINKLINYLNN